MSAVTLGPRPHDIISIRAEVLETDGNAVKVCIGKREVFVPIKKVAVEERAVHQGDRVSHNGDIAIVQQITPGRGVAYLLLDGFEPEDLNGHRIAMLSELEFLEAELDGGAVSAQSNAESATDEPEEQKVVPMHSAVAPAETSAQVTDQPAGTTESETPDDKHEFTVGANRPVYNSDDELDEEEGEVSAFSAAPLGDDFEDQAERQTLHS